MRAARSRDALRRSLTSRAILPPACIVLAGIGLLAAALAYRQHEVSRFRALRFEYRTLSAKADAFRRERGREGAIRAAVETLSSRSARRDDLRKVFDPVVSPPGNSGIGTRSVSYRVAGSGAGFDAYEIAFQVSGNYRDVARFVAGLEAGSPAFVAERLVLRPAEKGGGGVAGEIAARVLVR